MIEDITALEDGASLTAEVIVVGSGIAGAELATFLARRGVDVLLLESGREAFDPAIQALNDISFAGKPHRALDPDASYHRYLDPALRGVSRGRQFGGTSNVWTGKWKHLQRSDFEPRSWIADSDWPIGFDDLLPFYRAAAEDYGFADLEAEAERPRTKALRREVAAAGLKASSFWWEETPTRTAKRFGEEMRTSDRLRVVLGATVTDLVLGEDRRSVASVACRSLEGRSITARGERVVLATGAIETPRLLLASDGQAAEGIGNAHDLVGRFYTDHPKHHTSDLEPGPFCRRFATELQYGPKPRFCVCFALDNATQAERRLLEHVVYLKPLYERPLDRAKRWLRREEACRDANGRVRAYRVKLVTEQAPSQESRVRLGERRDALGVPEAVLDWRFTDHDRDSLRQVVELIEARFETAGIGRFDFGSGRPALETMTDAAHQMGTTRMADDPARGVVDRDCRVWGTDNLYVAGSAVFPTGPSYSPTFTILALARRLGEHLVRERARPALAVS
jgi:choline dehydrogenase-like flavoprotein